MNKLPSLYFILDFTLCLENGIDPVKMCEKSLDAGVRLIQLRAKDISFSYLFPLAKELRLLTWKFNAVFIINDHMELVKKVQADGLHVGQEDVAAVKVKKFIGSDKILGVTVHNRREAMQAENDGADYIGVGAVFPTSTKNTKPAKKSDLNEAINSVSIPAFLIGGINTENYNQLEDMNHHGVAVSSSIIKSSDITSTVESLTVFPSS